MSSYSEAAERFFDSHDEVSSASGSGFDCSDNNVFGYEFWTKKLESVDERRAKFFKWIDLRSDWFTTDVDEEDNLHDEEIKNKTSIDRLRDDSETVLANLDSETQFLSSRSSQSFYSYDSTEFTEDGVVEEDVWKIKNLDDGTEFVVDALSDHGTPKRLREVGSNKMLSLEEFQQTLGTSSLVQRLLRKESKGFNVVDTKKKRKTSWLRRLSLWTRNSDKTKRGYLKSNEISSKIGASRRVKVHAYKKHSKELSSLYTGQEFSAHEGSILTMKFSPDGNYLASAGEDGIVRVWKVLEDDILNNFDINDPSCLYFSLNRFSMLAPFDIDKQTTNQMTKSLRKSSDSACVILPPKVFRLLEKPLHEFYGHTGEVLALSWSKDGHLLSSSVDKTARLWKLGHDQCLGVYSHNNYVTCVEFNPVDDNYFISGSIDGKIRIWEVEGCRVVDWIDIREIVTAVCYSPDGKGGVIGSMEGNCRFYDVVDNRVQLGDQICLKGKKKLTGKRITGFQFCPSDVNKVLVTSADSQVRMLSGTNIVRKFKGSGSSGSQVPASFTSDGEHIVSTSEDSHVRVWSYNDEQQQKSKLWSSESFPSHNASIAIPWCGLKTKLGARILGNGQVDEKLRASVGFLLDALYRGSATWPEEKLLTSPRSMCRSELKFLKSAWQSALNSPNLWGLVIVTAGWDGCIRTFLNYGLPIRF